MEEAGGCSFRAHPERRMDAMTFSARVQKAAYLGLAAAHAPRPCPAEPARLSVVLLSNLFGQIGTGCQKLVEGSAPSCPTERPHTGHCLGISSSSSEHPAAALALHRSRPLRTSFMLSGPEEGCTALPGDQPRPNAQPPRSRSATFPESLSRNLLETHSCPLQHSPPPTIIAL
ncbi:hypothetical protein L1887_49701 [Cichorium endivia]|nr:hypothetical protein L1887_49701 [Cichorium endivia]